ncbi:hypothetical protein P1J78_00385 [Psychromarinibacter sp. C21-152]|uniref:Uncharacterized protein n=1 Tax=Psychromarinibacter sediminicola TaxID=3033385 RepID=A0AAE3NPB6_9RHOB|nr:hypothetical protein [Psychromarinibacter sediminicola]MDF0599174.1 hypothetical protein [Psychromarinibacter sediminicola]
MRDRLQRGIDMTVFAVGLFSLTTAVAATAVTRLSDDAPGASAVIEAAQSPVG